MAVERKRAHDDQGREYWWKNNQWEPVNEVSGVEAIAIGAGESFVNLGRGVQQLGFGAGEFLGIEGAAQGQRELAERQAGDQQIMQGLREENPVSTFVGNVLPSIVSAPLGGSSLLGQAALGFGEGALSFGNAQERLTRGGMNAALVGGVGKGLPMAARVSQSIIDSGSRIRIGGIANAGDNLVSGVSNAFERGANRFLGARGKSIADELADEAATGVQSVADDALTDFAQDSVGAARVPGTGVRRSAAVDSETRKISDALEARVDKQGNASNAEVSPQQRADLQTLRDEGFVLEPGMNNNNRASRLLSESMKSDVMTANTFEDMVQIPNRSKLNEKLLNAFGETGDEITDSTLGRIESKINAQYGEVWDAVPNVKLDSDFTTAMKSAIDDMEEGVAHLGKNDPIVTRAERMLKWGEDGKEMSAAQFQKVRTQLRELQRSAKNGNDSNAFGDMVEALDDAFQRVADETSPGAADTFKKATQEWRLFNALESGKAIGNDGTLNLPTLTNNLKRNFKREFGRDNRFKGEEIEATSPEFLKLFRSIRALNKYQPIIGDSGTASRGQLGSIFQDPTAAIAKVASRRFIRAWIKNAQKLDSQ